MPDHEENQELDPLDQIAIKRADAEATVVLLAGGAVVFTPIVWIIASTVAAFNGVELKLDERILTVSLGAIGTIIAFAFGKGVLNSIRKGLS